MTALELAARTARAGIVAADAGEVVVPGRSLAGLHVRSAVDGRGRVLQPLRTARSEPGWDRPGLALGCASGAPGVGAVAGPAVPLGGLGSADAAVPLGRRGPAPGTPTIVGPGRGARGVCPGAALRRYPTATRLAGAARGGTGTSSTRTSSTGSNAAGCGATRDATTGSSTTRRSTTRRNTTGN